MGYRVSGILKLPDGTPANNAEIEFISRKNFSPLVQELKSNIKCSATGAYDVTLEYGEYAVVVYPGGTYPAALGTIILAADTVAGQDLPTLLQQAGWQPATPEYIQQITQWLAEANEAASAALASELAAKVSETNAKASELAAESDRAEVAAKSANVEAKHSEVVSKAAVVDAKTAQVVAAESVAVAAADTASQKASAAAGHESVSLDAATRAENAALSMVGAIIDGGECDLSGGVYPRPVSASGITYSTVWFVAIGGAVGGVAYGAGDQLRYTTANSGYYFKVDAKDDVYSVNGEKGAVTVTPEKIGAEASGTASQLITQHESKPSAHQISGVSGLQGALNNSAATSREALRRSYAEVGYNVVGTFQDGFTYANANDVGIDLATGNGYTGPIGQVAPGTDPTADPLLVSRSNDTLRSNLSSNAGSGMLGFSHEELYAPASVGFRLKNSVYATDAPFNAPTDGSDSASHINSALNYCAANNRDLVLNHLFKIGSTVTIPSNVTVICLTRQCGLDSTATGANKAVVMDGMNSKFIGGTVKGLNNPASTTIRQDGVFFGLSSSFCKMEGTHVYGFYAKGFGAAGSGVGVNDSGTRNKITKCELVDSKFCVRLVGAKGEIVLNYISNHFLTQTVEGKPWTEASNFWDGIVSEGIVDYLIAFNTVTECGQSGIYTGGNGGLSKSNRIIGNIVDKCWNRGIDQGVNSAQSASNDVIGQNIIGNICRNNRENNIWLAGTTGCNASGNTSIYDAEYATLFAGYYGGHAGIALTNGAVGTVPHRNSITDNNCYDSEGYANISISCGASASVNTIDGNTTPQGCYLVNIDLYARNNFDFLSAPDWTPQLVGGAGSVGLGASTGRTLIRGRKASFNISLDVSSVSSPSGHLVVGYVPPLSGKNIRFSDVKITNYNGLDSTIGNSQLVAYMSGDQVNIARVNNGSRAFDVRQFLKAGSSIIVSGEVEFYA